MHQPWGQSKKGKMWEGRKVASPGQCLKQNSDTRAFTTQVVIFLEKAHKLDSENSEWVINREVPLKQGAI